MPHGFNFLSEIFHPPDHPCCFFLHLFLLSSLSQGEDCGIQHSRWNWMGEQTSWSFIKWDGDGASKRGEHNLKINIWFAGFKGRLYPSLRFMVCVRHSPPALDQVWTAAGIAFLVYIWIGSRNHVLSHICSLSQFTHWLGAFLFVTLLILLLPADLITAEFVAQEHLVK